MVYVLAVTQAPAFFVVIFIYFSAVLSYLFQFLLKMFLEIFQADFKH